MLHARTIQKEGGWEEKSLELLRFNDLVSLPFSTCGDANVQPRRGLFITKIVWPPRPFQRNCSADILNPDKWTSHICLWYLRTGRKIAEFDSI